MGVIHNLGINARIYPVNIWFDCACIFDQFGLGVPS